MSGDTINFPYAFTFTYSISQERVDLANSLRQKAADNMNLAADNPELRDVWLGVAIGHLGDALELLIGPPPTISFSTVVPVGTLIPSPETPSPGGPEPGNFTTLDEGSSVSPLVFGNPITK